ncbi:hypothetical protein BC831DRAFT_457734 [Entophlyctis helioformis]|nr:hypothetical protein BC831DRAFT_457734 [Entophlyctis helioformis]
MSSVAALLLEKQTAVFVALYVVNFISNAIFTFGVATDGQYGPGEVCLLFIEAYRFNQSNNSYVFSAYSAACSVAISLGSFSFAALLAVAAGRLYFAYKQNEPAKRVIFVFAAVATAFAVFFLVMAPVTNAGLGVTCTQFEKNGNGRTCGGVFNDGFYANDTSIMYKKSLTTLRAAVTSGWITFISWAGIAGMEWYSYKTTTVKWW